MSDKFVYFFGKTQTDGKAGMKDYLGGKGANLAEMTSLGIPVPPGFTIATTVCDLYYKNNCQYPEALASQVDEALAKMEKELGKKFGDPDNALLVSVRSGAAVSMPGMMDTVLNLGLNQNVVDGIAKKTGNPRFAWDAYRRFIQMYSNVVLNVDHHHFEEILEEIKASKKVDLDTDLDENDLKKVVEKYLTLVKNETGKTFATDPKEQLWGAIDAVFGSWNNPRAIKYRQLNEIRGLLGTAVNIQAMVYGNMGNTSGTGVAFTRNPSTGERKFYGEFLINAQGEDVVAGIRTPSPISELEKVMPEAYKQLVAIYQKLENHYKDMQDIEFTIEDKTLFMLQTRNGKRTAAAAVRTAVEMVAEGLIDQKTALLRVGPEQLDQLLHPTIDPKAKVNILATGLPASPGAAVGKIVFSAQKAEDMNASGEKVILVRTETSPEDIGGMVAAQGILTARGGMTSHAAVVARGMGKCCVAGCSKLVVQKDGTCTINGQSFKEGDWISLNGSTGDVIEGEATLQTPELTGDFEKIMEWANETRVINVRTNADTPHDSQVAIEFGAEGIGLCRTEHMFFEGDRIDAVREMILADDKAGREKALEKLLPIQREDFIGIFKVMHGKPVTIRLLDPPLHEFVPHTQAEIDDLAQKLGVPAKKLADKVESLKEFNPMLGHRGCRLAVTYPEIYQMQAKAIFQAVAKVAKEGIKVIPEVMIPLVSEPKELETLKNDVETIAQSVLSTENISDVKYLIGTMIEIPRAALLADQIAQNAEFFSFGTNDLTQMTFGLSRDDSGSFLPEYISKGILESEPFQVLDQSGVGELIKIGIEKGRKTKPNLKIGICGEHGGNPPSVIFCHQIGMNYVSCSPYRVPIAILAAAHAQILHPRKKVEQPELVNA